MSGKLLCAHSTQSLFGLILQYDCGGDEVFIFHMSLGGKVTQKDPSKDSSKVSSTASGNLTSGSPTIVVSLHLTIKTAYRVE